MPISDYTQLIIKQRNLPLQLANTTEQRLIRALRQVWSELESAIRESTNSTDRVVLAQWLARQNVISRLLGEFGVTLKRDITTATTQVATTIAEQRETITNDLLREFELSLVVDFNDVPAETLARLAQRQDVEGLKFSANVWGNNQFRAINDEVLSAIIRGEPSSDLAKRLRAFVLGSQEFTSDELKDLRRIQGVSRRKLGASINAKAKRLARTEIMNAAWEASQNSANRSPVVAGIQWNTSANHAQVMGWDVCDIFAEQDLFGLGPGIYPPNRIPPRPHPNDRCFMTEVLRPIEAWDTPKPDIAQQANPAPPSTEAGTQNHIDRQLTIANDLLDALP